MSDVGVLAVRLYTAYRDAANDGLAHVCWGDLDDDERAAWVAVAMVAAWNEVKA